MLLVKVCCKNLFWVMRFSLDLVENLIKTDWAEWLIPLSWFSFSHFHSMGQTRVGCRPLQAGPKVTPEITLKHSFRYCADNGIKYTAEQPHWANHSQTMLITSSWHVSRCGFSLGPPFIISRVWKHAAVQHAWLFRYTFYTKKPWREPINCQFRERGNPHWQSISSLRHAGDRSTLNSVHCANWITHDCRSISRSHAGCWAWCFPCWKENRSNDHRNADFFFFFRWSSAQKLGKEQMLQPLPCLFALDSNTVLFEEASLERSWKPRAVKFCR